MNIPDIKIVKNKPRNPAPKWFKYIILFLKGAVGISLGIATCMTIYSCVNLKRLKKNDEYQSQLLKENKAYLDFARNNEAIKIFYEKNQTWVSKNSGISRYVLALGNAIPEDIILEELTFLEQEDPKGYALTMRYKKARRSSLCPTRELCGRLLNEGFFIQLSEELKMKKDSYVLEGKIVKLED